MPTTPGPSAAILRPGPAPSRALSPGAVPPASASVVELRGVAAAPSLLPVPEEAVVHRRLRSAFIDLDRLVASLRADRLTGYLRAQSRTIEGVVLFDRGEPGLAAFRGDQVVIGPPAGELVRRHGAAEDVLLDVVRVRRSTADLLPRLLREPRRLFGFARFLIVDELVAQLVDERADVALVVAGRADIGVALIRGGRVDLAYSHAHPRPSASLDPVVAAARERGARVELLPL